MEVYRISTSQHAKKLTASGRSARWNKDNQFVLYTGEVRSLSALEQVVRRSGISSALKYEVMVISIADDERLFTRVAIKDLPKDWRELGAYSQLQDIGSDWYTGRKSLVLQVPSAIIPQEFNYIINISHPDFSKHVTLARNEEFFWDQRLLV